MALNRNECQLIMHYSSNCLQCLYSQAGPLEARQRLPLNLFCSHGHSSPSFTMKYYTLSNKTSTKEKESRCSKFTLEPAAREAYCTFISWDIRSLIESFWKWNELWNIPWNSFLFSSPPLCTHFAKDLWMLKRVIIKSYFLWFRIKQILRIILKRGSQMKRGSFYSRL